MTVIKIRCVVIHGYTYHFIFRPGNNIILGSENRRKIDVLLCSLSRGHGLFSNVQSTLNALFVKHFLPVLMINDNIRLCVF